MSAFTGIFSLPLALSERTGRFVISAFTGAAFAFPFGIVRVRRYGRFAQRPLNQNRRRTPCFIIGFRNLTRIGIPICTPSLIQTRPISFDLI